jgi:hypothetical protein
MVMVDAEKYGRDINTVRKIVAPDYAVLFVLKPFSPPQHVRFGNRAAVIVKNVKEAMPVPHDRHNLPDHSEAGKGLQPSTKWLILSRVKHGGGVLRGLPAPSASSPAHGGARRRHWKNPVAGPTSKGRATPQRRSCVQGLCIAASANCGTDFRDRQALCLRAFANRPDTYPFR